MRISVVEGNLVVASLPPPPQAMWPGGADSSRVLFTWWPAVGPPADYYYIYRDGTLFYPAALGQTGVTATTGWAGNGNGQFLFVDIVGTPSTTHTYQVASVIGGNVGTLSSPLTLTTLGGPGTTLPTPVVDPSNWIVAEQLPTSAAVICTTTAQLTAALNGSNINGNNLIVIPKGTVLTAPLAGWTLPAWTGTAGSSYIICDQSPVYNASGTLIPYSYVAQNVDWTTLTATAAIAANATSLTLTAAYTGRSGVYPTYFQSSTAGGLNENRLCTYTNGSTAVTWNTNVPLAGAATTKIQAHFGNYVTPGDVGSMATLQQTGTGTSGTIFNVPAGCTNVRLIGLNITPTGTGVCGSGIAFTPTQVNGAIQAPAQNFYVDRCIVGNDSANLGAGFAYMNHGIANVNCVNFLVHQCFTYGFANNGANNGGVSPDTQAIFLQGSGPFCIQNSFIEADSEGVLSGGAYVAQTQQPTGLTYRYNYNQKATQWLTSALGSVSTGGPKNHFELKSMVGAACYGNLHVSCWQTFNSGGQNGCSFVIDVADQGCITTGNPLTNWTPWLRVTDIDIHDNKIVDCGQLVKFAEASGDASNVTARCRFANNIGMGNPIGGGMYPALIWVQPWCPDITIDNNTLIMNSTAPGWQGGSTSTTLYGITPGSPLLTPNGTPNGLPVAKDRWTITDNITDGAQFFHGDNSQTGLTAVNTHLTNYTIKNNLTTTDTNNTYPTPIYLGVPYSGIGTTATITNTYPPVPSSQWNVVSGTYATASTTGGPIGSFYTTGVTLHAQVQGIVKDWTPGYLGFFFLGQSGIGGFTSFRRAQYDADHGRAHANLVGYLLNVKLVNIEGSFNNYSNFAEYVQDIQYLANTYNLSTGIEISTYGNSSGPGSTLPAYLYQSTANGYATTDPNYSAGYERGFWSLNGSDSPVVSGTQMFRARLDLAPIRDRVVAAHAYLAQQAQVTIKGVTYTGLDGCPFMQWILVDEEVQPSNYGNCLNAHGYGTSTMSNDNYYLGWIDLIKRISALWPRTNVLIPFNFIYAGGPGQNPTVSNANIVNLMAQIAASNCVFIPPDTVIDQGSGVFGNGNKAFNGQIPGGQNWRGIVPAMAKWEQPDMVGGSFNNPGTFAQLSTYSGQPMTAQGSISGTTMTLTSVSRTIGSNISSMLVTGTNVLPQTYIMGAQLSGAAGGVGTYTVSVSQTVAATTLTIGNNLQASVMIPTIQTSGVSGANWANDILPAVNSTPVTVTPNSVYPSVYPPGGLQSSLPQGTVGVFYTPTTLVGSGGTAPYTFTASNLPAGLTLSTTGVISGTPTVGFNSSVAVTVKDSLNNSSVVNIPFTVVSPLAFNQVFNFANFSGSPPMTLVSSNASTIFTGGKLQLCSGTHVVGSAWYNPAQVNIAQFRTDFTFQFPAGQINPACKGLTFMIQNSNNTTNPPAQNGYPAPPFTLADANLAGAGAYWNDPSNPTGPDSFQYGFGNSVYIKFDMSSSGGTTSGAPSGGHITQSGNTTPFNPLTASAKPFPNSVGLYTCVGPSAGLIPANDINGSGVNFYNGNVMTATVVYDGSILTLFLKDTVTNAQLRISWPVSITTVVGGNTAWVGFTGGQAGNNASGGSFINSWSFNSGVSSGGSLIRLSTPTFSVPAGQYSSAQTVSITGSGSIFYSTNGQAPTTAYSGPISISASTFLQAVATQSGSTDSPVASAYYQIAPVNTPNINFPNFTGAGNLLSLVGVSDINGANLELVPSILGLPDPPHLFAGAAWFQVPVNVGSFTSTFTFQVASSGPYSNTGMTFCIQNQPPATDYSFSNAPPFRTQTVLRWASGGPLAYANGSGFGYSGNTGSSFAELTGLVRSVAIKFDSTNGGTPTTTGLYTNGADVSQNSVTATGLNFSSGHQFKVQMDYNNATSPGNNLRVQITDQSSSTQFTNSYAVNVASVVGASTAYVGFTAGSYYCILQQILNWTWTS